MRESTVSGIRRGTLAHAHAYAIASVLGLVACADASDGAESDAVSAGTTDGAAPFRAELVFPELWVPDPAADPFADHRPAEVTCELGFYAEFGVFEVDTGLCNYGVFSQPVAVEVPEGTTLELALVHDDLVSDAPAAVAHIALALPELVLWEAEVPIPAAYGILNTADLPLPAIPAGTPMTLHLHNHGFNAYRLIIVRAFRD